MECRTLVVGAARASETTRDERRMVCGPAAWLHLAAGLRSYKKTSVLSCVAAAALAVSASGDNLHAN